MLISTHGLQHEFVVLFCTMPSFVYSFLFHLCHRIELLCITLGHVFNQNIAWNPKSGQCSWRNRKGEGGTWRDRGEGIMGKG